MNTITATQAREWLLNGEAILIDVREPDEFKERHIAQAQSVPLSVLQAGNCELHYPKNAKIIVQCLKGKRGETGCAILGQQFTDNEFFNIEGGLSAWEAEGLPTVTPAGGPKISIFRQVQIIVGALIALMIVLGFAGMSAGFVIAGILGIALAFAGLTGWCGLAMLLQKMPWNR